MVDLSRFGTKHTCWSCGCRFYDLNRPNPTCPKCGSSPSESKPSSARKLRLVEDAAPHAPSPNDIESDDIVSDDIVSDDIVSDDIISVDSDLDGIDEELSALSNAAKLVDGDSASTDSASTGSVQPNFDI